MMTGIEQPEALAADMRADGWAEVLVRCIAYDWKGNAEYQVDATNPHTGERVYMPNANVYHVHYGAPA